MAEDAPTTVETRLAPGAVALKAFREKHKISMEEASRQLHVARPSWWAWENGQARPTALKRKDIETWTGGEVLEAMWVFDDEREPVKPFAAMASTGTEG